MRRAFPPPPASRPDAACTPAERPHAGSCDGLASCGCAVRGQTSMVLAGTNARCPAPPHLPVDLGRAPPQHGAPDKLMSAGEEFMRKFAMAAAVLAFASTSVVMTLPAISADAPAVVRKVLMQQDAPG